MIVLMEMIREGAMTSHDLPHFLTPSTREMVRSSPTNQFSS